MAGDKARSDIEALKAELAGLRDLFQQKTADIQARIELLESESAVADTSLDVLDADLESAPAASADHSQDTAAHAPEFEAQDTSALSESDNETVEPVEITTANDDEPDAIREPAVSIEPLVQDRLVFEDDTPETSTSPTAQPSAPSEPSRTTAETITSVVDALGPLGTLLNKAWGTYTHFRDQGKAPVFFMTLAGLLTLAFGFSYLLQYSFNLLSDTAKVGLGFLVGMSVSALGAIIAVRKPDFAEYGSSLIALGVVFNYLCAYFMGPYFGLVSDVASFAVLVVVTAASYWLARRFETRIVAVITLVGGVFSPLLLGNLASINTAFVAYLLLLSAANLHLARKISWAPLATLTFALSLGMVEYARGGSQADSWPLLLLVHGFFFLYAHHWSFAGRALRSRIDKLGISILTANLFYLLYALVSFRIHPVGIAAVCIIDAALLTIPLLRLRILASQFAAIFVLMIGALVAIAIMVLAPVDVTGLLWGLEGVALVYLGFRHQQGLVRLEGQVLFLIAVVKLIIVSAAGLASAATLTISSHWFSLLSIGLLVWANARVMRHFRNDGHRQEHHLTRGFQETYAIWGAVVLVLLFAAYTTSAFWTTMIVVAAWCLFRANRRGVVLAEWVALALCVGPVVQLGIGYKETATTLILAQPFWSWIAAAQLLLILWGYQWIYDRFLPAGRLASSAQVMRTTAYCFAPGLLVLNLFYLAEHHLLPAAGIVDNAILYDQLVIGALLLMSRWVVGVIRADSEPRYQHHRLLVRESLSIWFVITFLTLFARFAADYWLVSAVIPLALLMTRGVGQRLRVTETVAWSLLLLFLAQIVLGAERTGTFSFTRQHWITQLAWIELFVCGWGILEIYRRAGATDGLYPLAEKTRLWVYLALPLVFVPSVIRRAPEYLPTALWVSTTICWLLHKRLQRRPLLIELRLLAGLAIVATVGFSLVAMVTSWHRVEPMIAVLTGMIFLGIFTFVEHGWERHRLRDSAYRLPILWSVFFFGFAAMATGYAISGSLLASLFTAGVYFAAVTLRRPVWPPARSILCLTHKLAWALLAAVPLMLTGWSHPLVVILATASMALLAYLIHANTAQQRALRKTMGGPTVQWWLFHGTLLAGYISILNSLLTGLFHTAVSIALIAHAIVVLFLTLKPRYRSLIKLSVALYVAAGIKVLAFDMAEVSVMQRIIALMVIGSLLLVAAYQYQRVARRAASIDHKPSQYS